MITDNLTNTVFLSEWLSGECPVLYKSLKKALKANGVACKNIGNGNDYWCRDYMPIQMEEKSFVLYKYNPDYLQARHKRRFITDVWNAKFIDLLLQSTIERLDLTVDGGNVVKCGNHIVMTDKVFAENSDKSPNEVRRMLDEAFQCEVVFLPWDKSEKCGHSDGIVHYAGGNRVLMTNYDDFDAAFAKEYRRILERYFDVIPLKYNVKQKHKRSWAYINFLQVGKLVLVPQLGIPEDEQALQQIQTALPQCKVEGVPTLEAVRKGGALNCVSWNVRI